MSNDSFEAVFSHATLAILVSDEQGRIISANRSARTLFGYDTDMTELRIEALVPDSVVNRHERLRASFNANPQVRAMGHGRDLYAKRSDGSVFPAEISLSYYRQNDALFAVAYIIDITFKKEAERTLLEQKDRIEQLNAQLEQKVADRTHALMATLHQLEQSKDELARALAAERELGELKSRFVSMASHEFRTPLSAVLTSASLIEKYPGGDQQDKRLRHIQRIKSSVNHLNDILEEFLSVGRLEEGRVEANWSSVSVPVLVSEVVADLQGLLKAGQVIQTAFNGAETVQSDPSLLRKILVNLLSNAIKYSGENQSVWLKADSLDSALKITIRDEGIGISSDDQKHLFERFFRAKNVTNFAGTGLGLHIVAKYLELLGGTIDLTSQLGQGTTITLTLPYENNSAH
ncbi:PAS domain-containing sensor histidine kinase [Spirosoma radiotolerans]|uniref:histidine kinase n=1 Tax=Spirosoma radiotolerans TaxID=1379870 RepID=A0A0E3V985_9BACT|nr:PAS domain-containing sensor histidine kinase [Spirosoma radiotolerans]AKD57452.1 histidine kinase [Spirosoma radiotolerans]